MTGSEQQLLTSGAVLTAVHARSRVDRVDLRGGCSPQDGGEGRETRVARRRCVRCAPCLLLDWTWD